MDEAGNVRINLPGGNSLTEQAPTVTNKQSTEATIAVRNWNVQAAGSAFDRNAPGQMPLPALA